MIITGKYQFIPDIYFLLGTLLSDYAPLVYDLAICPIPLAPRRKKWRGFNQSEILSHSISEQRKQLYAELLIRSKNTKTQKDLSKPDRLKNLQSAFMVDFLEPIPKRIVLIDDVTTTGTTFIEATKALKKAGAQVVWCIAIAQD
ncbi:MAG: hypothetical protein M3Q64_00630 [bacterium]|nr:hypothetical protein [bacterium]